MLDSNYNTTIKSQIGSTVDNSDKQVDIKQQKFSRKDKLFLYYPKLEKWIVEEINEIKRRKRLHILIACSMAMFCLCLAQQMAFFCIKYQMFNSFNILNLTAELSTSFFTQVIASLCVDFFSILPVSYFTVGLSIASLSFFGYTAILNDNRLFFLAMFFSFICLKLYYVCFSYIIYDSAYSLKKRFNNAGIFSLLVLNISMIATNVVKIVGLHLYDYNDFDPHSQSQKDKLFKFYLRWLLIFSSVGIALIIISVWVLDKSYGQIKNIREQSQRYKLFTIYQGIGINLKLIWKYFKNKDFLYLCILCCIGCASISPNNIFFNLQASGQFDEYEVSIFFLISCIGGIIGHLIFVCLNESSNLIASGYICVQKTMIVISINKLVEIIILSYSDHISKSILIIIYSITYIINGAIFYLVFVINHQLSICLQPFRSSLRCMGIGIITTFCDFNYIIYKVINILDPQFEKVMALNITFFVIAIIVSFYSYHYIKKRNFNKLYLAIRKQHYEDVGFTLDKRAETL